MYSDWLHSLFKQTYIAAKTQFQDDTAGVKQAGRVTNNRAVKGSNLLKAVTCTLQNFSLTMQAQDVSMQHSVPGQKRKLVWRKCF